MAGSTRQISRMSHCFSGPLSRAMNAKPELKAIGKKMRCFGREYKAPFVQPGYFWVEPVERRPLAPVRTDAHNTARRSTRRYAPRQEWLNGIR